VLRHRSTEAGLLFLAALVIGFAYTLASLGTSSSIPVNIGPFLGVVLGLFVVAHVAVRRLAPNADQLILPLAAILNGLGYVMIARLNEQLAAQQAAWTGAGIIAFIVTLAVIRRVRQFERLRYTVGLIGVLLLVAPLIPGVGRQINGARIWIRVGPFSLQPGEFAKIALAIFFAAYVVERRELLTTSTWRLGPLRLPDPRHLAPLLVAWAFSLLVMMFQRDLGSALLFFVLFLTVLWVGTGRAGYLAVGGALFGAGVYLAWQRFTHVQTRVSMWLDPWQDPTDRGFQIVQATYALAWGGVTGAGLGQGIDGRIPYQETDFIFAMIGEELGLLGTTAVLIVFLLIVGSGFRIAARATDPFAKLLACGLTTLIGFQAFLIMGGVTRLLPLTGVTLPFVSYGGSSLVSNWILMALLIRLSDEQRRSATQSAANPPAPVAVSA